MTFDIASVIERLQQQTYHLIASLPLLVLALLVIWLAWRVGSWLSRRNSLDRVARRNPFLRDLVKTSTRWAVTLGGILVALEILNATALVGAVLGTAGVMGVALGFAFKETLENYLAGILMSVRQPFAPRDHVVIDGNEGVVIALTSRATILMTLDGNHLRLPNALVFRSVMLNYTRNPTRRFEFDVGVGVNEDLLCAQRLGTGQLTQVDGVIASPPPRAYIAALGDSNVQVRFHGWVDQRTHDFLLVKSEAIRRVKLALEEAGMDMPEPIYRVQLARRGDATAADSDKRMVADERLAETAPLDTRAQTDLDGPIRSDETARGSADLLNPDAPRE